MKLLAYLFISSFAIGAEAPKADSYAALKEANRVQSLSIETLMKANDALQSAMPTSQARNALEDAKAASDKAVAASEINRKMIEQSRRDLVRLMQDQTRTTVLWNVSVLVTLLSLVALFVYHDHRHVQGAQSSEFDQLIKAIQEGRIESFGYSQSAMRERGAVKQLNIDTIDAMNHINEKVLIGKAEVERKIDKIEQTTDKSHDILEEMRDGGIGA